MLRKILTTDQNANNALKLYESESGCCGEGQRDCQSVASFATSETLTAITIKSEDGLSNITAAITSTAGATAAATKAAIKAALATLGYEENDDTEFSGIAVALVSSNTQVTITGDINVVSLTHSGGTATATVTCTREEHCTYTLATASAGGATNTLRVNGVDRAIGAITPGTTSGATVKAAVEAALAASGVSGTVTVTTAGSGGSTTYTIVVTAARNDNTFVYNGVYIDRTSCADAWV